MFWFKFIYDAFYKEKLVKTKSNFSDLVTETDKNKEKILTDAIKAKYPSHMYKYL